MRPGHAWDAEDDFTRLYEEHRRGVYAYLLGRTGDPESARDLLQETFLRAWRHLDALRSLPVERQRSWIFSVTRHLLIDAHRRRAAGEAASAALRVTVEEAAPAVEEPPARVETAERLAVLEEAIRRLPEPLRVALAMCTVGEMTSAEAGRLLGEPAGTVRYRVSLARRRLAGALREADEA